MPSIQAGYSSANVVVLGEVKPAKHQQLHINADLVHEHRPQMLLLKKLLPTYEFIKFGVKIIHFQIFSMFVAFSQKYQVANCHCHITINRINGFS